MRPELVDVANEHDVVMVGHLPAWEAKGSPCFRSTNTCVGSDQHVHIAASVAGALALAMWRTTWATASVQGR
eukprot:1588466-Pyramimonas_sp.AAC.1